MVKRKEPDVRSKVETTPSKRSRKSLDQSEPTTPASKPARSRKHLTSVGRDDSADLHSDEESPTPNTNDVIQNQNHKKAKILSNEPAGDHQISAKRNGTVVADQNGLGNISNKKAKESNTQDDGQDTEAVEGDAVAITPSKRGRGRPKGAKNKRSPTPEGDLPPEERFFFQTRTGPAQLSSNSFANLHLLSHDEFIEQAKTFEDSHGKEKAYLLHLHSRSFPQWSFELEQGFSLCLYGLGSKRALLNKFADWVYQQSDVSPTIVIINGYTPKLNLRNVLNTIHSALLGTTPSKPLVGSPRDIVDFLSTEISKRGKQLYILVNSIDGPSLRRTSIQTLLASLAAHEKVHFIASADSPAFQLLWNSSIKDQYKFVFHDATTFASYDAEVNSVDDVNELLGRKGRRAGGKEGIGFVLKSLPENARNLYRILLAEILTTLSNGFEDDIDPDLEAITNGLGKGGQMSNDDIGVEYRLLYQKASEEFICSSDMNFRFLLKEFHDHQMITSRRDASGTEILGVPLARDEMEAVLEELVAG